MAIGVFYLQLLWEGEMTLESPSPMERHFPKRAAYLRPLAWRSASNPNETPKGIAGLFGVYDQDGEMISMCWNPDYGQKLADTEGLIMFTLQ